MTLLEHKAKHCGKRLVRDRAFWRCPVCGESFNSAEADRINANGEVTGKET
jgi:rubrerythrin